MSENDLLALLEKANVNLGDVDPRVIKGWFDTDCADLLKWMISNITEKNIITAQEATEFSQLENPLPQEQLTKKVEELELEYPGMFDVEMNLFDMEIKKDMIEVLEEDERNLDHQLRVNENLEKSLSAELSKVTAQEIQSQVELEFAQDECRILSRQLDDTHKETYDQIVKYSSCLNNFELAEVPEFVNKMDITELEEKFREKMSLMVKVEHDLSEMSMEQFVGDNLKELQDRIFHSKVSLSALQMEVEASQAVSNFLETYDVNSLLSFIDEDRLRKSIVVHKDLQTWMLKDLEETSLKAAEQFVSQPTVKYLKSQHQLLLSKSKYLEDIETVLMKILIHFTLMHGLYLQEKIDIDSSSHFFQNIARYVTKDINDCNFRKKAMLATIDEYEKFCLSSVEERFPLLSSLAEVVFKRRDLSLVEVHEAVTVLRNRVEDQKKRLCRFASNKDGRLKEIEDNIQVLERFLRCGPSCQIVSVPFPLRELLVQVNENLSKQKSSLKELIQVVKKAEERFSKEKMLEYRHQLFTYFMTRPEEVAFFMMKVEKELKH